MQKIVASFINKLRVKNYSDKTIKSYSNALYNFINSIESKDYTRISTKAIVDYLESRKFSSVSQQNQYIGALKLFAKHILNKKNIHLNKIERPKGEKKLPRVIDSELLKEKINSIKNLKHRAILSLTYSCGLRVSEVINLKIDDVDSNRMIIYIRNAKGRKDRIVPLNFKLLSLLRVYWNKHKPNVYLFNGQSELLYSSSSCNKLIKKYIGPSYTMHHLRHSYATGLVESNINLRTIQSILGHTNIKTTEIYTHVSVINFKSLPELI